MVSVSPVTLLLVTSIVLGAAAAILAWRARPASGAVPLVVLLAGQSWWSIAVLLQLNTGMLASKVFWNNSAWIGALLVPMAWLWFALKYTGRDRYVQRHYLAILGIIPTITVLLLATNSYHDLMYVHSELAVVGESLTINRTPGPWYWVATAYSYAVILLGIVALLSLVRDESIQFRGQGAALLIGTVVPTVTGIVYLLVPRSVLYFDPTPISFTVTGIAYLGAITRFRLLHARPTPNQRARELAFDRMYQAAIVIDDNDNVVKINQGAADVLNVEAESVLGEPAAEVVPEYEQVSELSDGAEEVSLRREDGMTQYEASVTPIHNARDREIGRVITYHDISRYLRQQQRLEVLNRTLRHNLRTETNLIAGYSDLVETEDNAEEVAVIRESARRVERISEKSRDIVQMFRRSYRLQESVPLGEIVTDTMETVGQEYPEADLRYEQPNETVRVDPALRPVVTNAVENAAEHNDPADLHVTVSAAVTGDDIRIEIADDGCGLEPHERAAVNEGRETQLRHASGLGLWLIRWGADIAGGSATLSDRTPTGTIVEVEVPRQEAPDERPEPPGQRVAGPSLGP